ncbi:hypothetical protein GCM10017711_37100 [Paeniglutamicibacter sulfureus]
MQGPEAAGTFRCPAAVLKKRLPRGIFIRRKRLRISVRIVKEAKVSEATIGSEQRKLRSQRVLSVRCARV